MKRSLTFEQGLKTIRAIFCLAFALLFLTETFIPLLQCSEKDPIELSENAEEGEEKKEKEKEVFDADEMFTGVEQTEFATVPKLTSGFMHFDFHSSSVAEIDTPPPERA